MTAEPSVVHLEVPAVLWTDLNEIITSAELSESERVEALAGLAEDLGLAAVRRPTPDTAS